ncbi:MAG: translation initiation factor [Ferruginibacter sp.]
MAKTKIPVSGIIYSTNPDFKPAYEQDGAVSTLEPAQQKLKVRLDTKHRGGKAVTLIEGFIGTVDDKEALGKKLKTFCGTGGSVKEGEILVQGDNREKLLQWLLKNGFKNVKKL